MVLTVKTVGLPPSYRKVAHLEIQTRFQTWLTLAEFRSELDGQNNVYFEYSHGSNLAKPVEISRESFAAMLKQHYGF